jgi:hypothetical protein
MAWLGGAQLKNEAEKGPGRPFHGYPGLSCQGGAGVFTREEKQGRKSGMLLEE